MKRGRLPAYFGCSLFIVSLISSFSFQAQTTAQVRPTEKPFLWRIEGSVPSYLYGTIHVPDRRVLELPDVVRRALESADVFNAEIPLDAATQAGLMSKVMLPQGQDLRQIAGEQVFARVIRALGKVLGSNAPPGATDMLANMLAPMKPWAVTSQIELLEFLPDVTAGRQPLDATLYGMASKAGKELGGLETVDEQVAVFEGFSTEEQIKMLVDALDELEKPQPGGVSPAQQLVKLYLAGDLNQLADEAKKQDMGGDQALNKKVEARVIDDRNTKMATRIAELCSRKPARSYFFAVGALHYAGNMGVLSQLTKKGFKITRLGPADASSIVRKPAA